MDPAARLCALLLLLHAGQPLPEMCGYPEMVTNTNAIDGKHFPVGHRLRYACQSGYKRKAGTSSLIICMKNATNGRTHWTMPNIECIKDISLASPTSATFEESEPPNTLPATENTFLTTRKPFPSSSADVSTPPPRSYAPQSTTMLLAQATARSRAVSSREDNTLSTIANTASRYPSGPSSLPSKEGTPPLPTESSSPSGSATSISALQGGLGATAFVLIAVLLVVCLISKIRSQRHKMVQVERPMDYNPSDDTEVTNMLAGSYFSSDVPSQEIAEEITVL